MPHRGCAVGQRPRALRVSGPPGEMIHPVRPERRSGGVLPRADIPKFHGAILSAAGQQWRTRHPRDTVGAVRVSRQRLDFGSVGGRIDRDGPRRARDGEVGAVDPVPEHTIAHGHGRPVLDDGPPVGIRPRDPLTAQWSWTGTFPTATFANDATQETQTVNFTVPLANAKLTNVTDVGKYCLILGCVIQNHYENFQSVKQYTNHTRVGEKGNRCSCLVVFMLHGGILHGSSSLDHRLRIPYKNAGLLLR